MDWWTGPFSALTTTQLYDLLALRQLVFVVEQTCPYLDADGLDQEALHLLGRQDGRLVAYARILGPDATRDQPRIGRVVTHPDVRGQGVGRPLMREAMKIAWQVHGTERPIHISAQAHLEDFYGSLGFVTSGPGYLEDDIPHLPMDYVGEPA